MKKIIMSLILAMMCISLCACGEARQTPNSEDNLLALQLKIYIHEATFYLSDSNKAVVDSLYAMKALDKENSIAYYKKALELVKDVKLRVDASIAYPNFISEELALLEENYEEIITLLSSFSEFSEKELDILIDPILAGTPRHILSLASLTAFSYLYEIREFDQLPDDEAQNTLKESWWKFGFNDDIQCPDTIDERELYLIWARQFFDEFNDDEFLEEIKVLRENDDLASPECNQKWAELIKNFI